MWVTIITFLVLMIFAIYFIILISPLIAALLVNGLILWIIGARGYTQLTKEHKEKYYAFGILVAAVFIIFNGFRTWHNIWWITVFLTVMFIAAQNYMLYDKYKIGKRIKDKYFKK